MIVRNFVKRSLDNQKKLLIILLTVTVISGLSAAVLQILFGGSSVYREVIFIEPKPIININAVGIPLEVDIWDGDTVRVESVAELPLIIVESERDRELTIERNDDFAISIFTLDMFRYKLKVYLPESFEFNVVNINS
jgi:hypothetical protein